MGIWRKIRSYRIGREMSRFSTPNLNKNKNLGVIFFLFLWMIINFLTILCMLIPLKLVDERAGNLEADLALLGSNLYSVDNFAQ